MKKFLLIAVSFLAGSILISCSSNSSTTAGGGTASAGATMVGTLQTKLNGAGNLLPSGASSFVAESENDVQPFAAIGSNWTSSTMPNPKNSGDCSTAPTPSNVTLKDWMGYEFDENLTRCNGSSINVFGKVKKAAETACAMLLTQSSSTSADMPTSGSVSISFTSSVLSLLTSTCGMSSSDASNLSGASGTLTFSVPSPSTTFDRKIAYSITVGSSAMTGAVYLKYTAAGDGAIATTESNGNGRSRTLLKYDATSKTLLAEYVSRSSSSPNPVYVHRLYKNETAASARVYSLITDNTNSIEYTVTGNPSVDGDVAVAISVAGYGFGAPISGQACVMSNTGTITTDNASTCGSFSSVTAAAATGGETVKTTVDGSSTWNDFSTVPAFNWSTTSDMLTSGI